MEISQESRGLRETPVVSLALCQNTNPGGESCQDPITGSYRIPQRIPQKFLGSCEGSYRILCRILKILLDHPWY